ncbi:MAG: hypothetical protein EOM03_13600 [Clostridia bacterium]|nr:hypothetical protein [Clostridia bacterium]
MHRGYVKVWRKLEDSGILQDQGACQFFLWAMFKATHKPRKQIVGNQVVNLLPGQFVSGRNAASQELGISPSKFVRTMEKMKMLEFVDTKPNNKFTVFSIINWARYQDEQTTNEQQTGQQADNKRTTSGQQADTNKNVNNAKNGKSEELNTSGKKPSKIPAAYSPEFESFWAVYPSRNGQKVKKAKAWEAFWKVTSNGSGITAELLTDKIKALAPQYGEYACDAVTWLNQRRWEDEVEPLRIFPKKPGAGKGSTIERAIANGQEWLAMQEVHQ